MGLLDWFSLNKKRIDYDIRQIVSAAAKSNMPPTIRQRETKETWQKQFGWYEGVISRGEFRTKNVMENLRLIRDINPDSSMAIWNFLRLANSGHELEVIKPNGQQDQRATDLLNEYAKNVGKIYGGGLDQIVNVLLLAGFTQGAVALEVELSENIKEVEDIHPVDPSTLDFRRDPNTNELQLVQKQQNGQYKVLNQEQVFYYPFDPDISDPYGRSPMLPILQIVFFQIEVLKDLKKVVHHQGHMRFDIKVVEEAIIENMPDEIKHEGPEAVRDFVSGYITDIQEQMRDLAPDDDFFHTDSVEIDLAGGGMSNSLDVTRVMDVINQQIVTALKQLPILLGRNEGTTETHGTIQWQIYVKGIESIQRGIKRLLERAYNVILRINGIQGSAKITFDPIRVTDRHNDAQAEEIETRTKIAQINQGWIDNDEASIEMVGHEAVNEPIQPVKEVQVMKDPIPAEDPIEEEKDRILKKKDLNQRSDTDEFVKEIDESWASDVARVTKRAERAYLKLLRKQKDSYIKRLKNANSIPSRVYADMRSLRSFMREETPEPPPSFEYWAKVNILHDSEEQMTLINEEGRDWMEQAIILAGEAALAELSVDIVFNVQDRKMLRWLQERSLRSAQLIQGATDKDVIMTLWDAVYEGDYTIKKASKALQESFSFSPARSERIARTEIISAGRSGQYFGDLQSGIVIGKKWVSAKQERTRKGHRAANGQVVKFDEPFLVAAGNGQLEPMMFPSDTSLGAGPSNTIQCRCWYKRILEGEDLE